MRANSYAATSEISSHLISAHRHKWMNSESSFLFVLDVCFAIHCRLNIDIEHCRSGSKHDVRIHRFSPLQQRVHARTRAAGRGSEWGDRGRVGIPWMEVSPPCDVTAAAISFFALQKRELAGIVFCHRHGNVVSLSLFFPPLVRTRVGVQPDVVTRWWLRSNKSGAPHLLLSHWFRSSFCEPRVKRTAGWRRIQIVCKGCETMFVARAPSCGEIVYLQELKTFS